jgi:two-component system LytT family sensor kinase
MKIKLPQYSGKDYMVLAITILPLTIALNSIIFGGRYFTQGNIFFTATIFTAILFCIDFTICGFIAMWLKKRMPAEEQTPRRLFYMIACFIALSGILLVTLFNGYEVFGSFNYIFNERGFIWAYVGMAIINIFLTLVIEGIARYINWQDNLKETEQIKKAFTQSQLLGLKSQVNPV